ncbi:MAG: NADH-quinone oxidoreductase subunit J [Clostridia bacterium]|nr:NADH-quinone oxidoreductase subunit J [Clostridia bacterium]
MVAPWVFWLLAIVTLAAALGVVTQRNIVYSAYWLILSFVAVAVLYMALEADLLAVIQILIYAGAVSILIVFAIMLTRRGDLRNSNPFNKYKLTGMVITAAFFGVLALALVKTPWAYVLSPVTSAVGPVAEAMMTKYVVPFEVAALLLLVGMVGAILMARGVDNRQ